MNSPSSPAPTPPTGQILTFYSYKGGTGRSMAVANIAWILASCGKRVLVIDWDLEAPGLHRYFAPFLADPELAETPGLIDFFVAFVEGSRLEAQKPTTTGDNQPWFDQYSDILDFAVSLDHEFQGDGTLDFVPAGRQGPSYGSLVSTFQWADFYEKLGGGVFLESVKKQLRSEYDHVIIDSRTGLSDTSGICTVQMPDDLVVFFTLNRQSTRGSAATAESAMRLRQKPSGEPGLRVWPVASRIDLTEKERLEAAREMAREAFTRSLWHLSRDQRNDYWARSEILYIPYYAYLETLAVAADLSGQTASLLGCMEQLTSWITQGAVTRLGELSKQQRAALLERINGKSDINEAPGGKSRACIYLSYARKDFSEGPQSGLFRQLREMLPDSRIFWDEDIPLGSDFQSVLDAELARAEILVVFVGREATQSPFVLREVETALAQGKTIVPVLLSGSATWEMMPRALASMRGVELIFSNEKDQQESLAKLVSGLANLATRISPKVVDPEDPQLGRWGGISERNGWKLTGDVKKVSSDWFSVELRVRSIAGKKLQGIVEFHLHPTFSPDVERVAARFGKAVLELHAYGAFTVGALLEDGTSLELDLSTLEHAPQTFRER